MSTKTGAVLIFAAVVVTFTYQLTTRLSTDALNFAMGVLCGMVASVPVSLGLLIALTRERGRGDLADTTREAPQPQVMPTAPRPQPTPQIIVVAPPNAQYGQPPGYTMPTPNPYPNYWEPPANDVIEGRDWRIIGDDA